MELQGLNKREMQVLAAANRDNYAISIYSVEKDLWQVDLVVVSPERHFQAYTQRGELKTWRELAGAVSYVQETCPDCKTVTIAIGNWTFARMEQHV